MAAFQTHDIVINTDYVTVIGEIKASSNTGNYSFHIGLHGRDGMTMRYASQAEAEEGRNTLIRLMNT